MNYASSIKSRGFTLIELLLVIAIVALIGMSSFAFYSRFLTQSAVSDTSDKFTGQLRKAQMYAMSGKQNSNWGVRYSGNQIILFSGNSYATRTPAFDETFTVNNNITVNGMGSDIIFTHMTGTASANTTVTIAGGGNSKSIPVNVQGVVGGGSTTAVSSSPWYNTAYLYKKKITIDHTKVGSNSDAWCNDVSGVTCDTSWNNRMKITFNNTASGTSLTNFPVLVVLNSSRIDYSKTEDAGEDLRFVDSSDSTTVLSHQIESWNEGGNSYIWVNVPQVNAASATDYIWLYYNNPSASDGQAAASVWSAYSIVYHMNETSGTTINDSAGTAQNGTKLSATEPNPTTSGIIGGAQDFNGSSAYIQTNSPGLPTGNFTYESWVNLNFVDDETLFEALDGAAGSEIRAYISNNIQFSVNISTATNTPPPTVGDWTHLAFVRNGTTTTTYKNGVAMAVTTSDGAVLNFAGCALLFGVDADSVCTGTLGNYMNGKFDEFRVTSTVRSADWVRATYQSESDTFNTYESEATLNNFPVLISLTDADFKTIANGGSVSNANGYDIIFTDSTETTKLDHEIEKYNASTGELQMWVRVPTLSASTDTVLNAYFGNNAISTSQENEAGVWNSNYKGVWHLSENPAGSAPQMNDSTSFSNDLTSYGTMTSGDQVTGKIDGSLDFDGTDDYIEKTNFSSNLSGATTMTLEGWIRPPASWPGTHDAYLSIRNEVDADLYILQLGGTPDIECRFRNSAGTQFTASQTITPNVWQHVAIVVNGSTTACYVNGTAGASIPSSGSFSSTTVPFKIANDLHNNYGQIYADEVRISNTNRSVGWLLTEYNNQGFPSTFYSIGAKTGQ